jgi:putative hydrolase of the HAD superfamily
VYHRIGRKYGSRQSPQDVECRFRDAYRHRDHAVDLSSSEVLEHEFWRAVVAEVLMDVTDAEACFQELHAWFAQPSAWLCYADVATTLTALSSRGYQLAIASNFDARLHTVRGGLPALESIGTCVVSSEVGWRKPHAEFFRKLAETCGCDRHQILMVGDDLLRDARGAQMAGLSSLWLDRQGRSDSGTNPIPTIRSLSELADIAPIRARPVVTKTVAGTTAASAMLATSGEIRKPCPPEHG